ncbi:MAG TPA: carbon-nitrogen hydrolase [Gemmatimonadaceae bacterium]|nr:carbon-nitrogen hydrolase [Gemmatimonadaceae bacterium]
MSTRDAGIRERAPFTVGLIQSAVSPDRAAAIDESERAIRAAAARGAQIICLQELFDAPYFCKVTDAERFDLAEPIPGPTVERTQRLARELAVVIVVPLFERRAPGVYHNSAAVVDADGALLGVYRKMHIPDDPLYHEKYYFAPGEIYDHGATPGQAAGFRVFQTRYATVGVLICWDQWYPEAARITSLMGAEILVYPTAIGWHPAEKAEWGAAQADAWRTIQRAHAIANGVYVAAVNRVGFEAEPGTDGIEFFGHSFVSDPFGRLIAEAGTDPAVLVATCDPHLIEYTRRNWPFLRDRRVDAYGPILNRYIGHPAGEAAAARPEARGAGSPSAPRSDPDGELPSR